MKIKEIRKEARDNLYGKWPKFIGMNLIVIAISVIIMIISFIPMFAGIASVAFQTISGSELSAESIIGMFGSIGLTYILFIICIVFMVPLGYSYLENIIKLKRDDNTKCTEFIKNIFKNFGRAWKIALWMMVKILVLYLIFLGVMIVSMILMVVIAALKLEILSIIMAIFIFVALITFEVLLIIRVISLTLSQYIGIDNPEFTGKQCVDKSIELMKGYRLKLIGLNLSFLGWVILSYLTFGMGFVFLIPYMQVSYVCFYEKVLEEKKFNIDI